mgnify:CR=1 FL=1
MKQGYLVIAQNSKDADGKSINYVRMAYALALSIKHTQSQIKNISIPKFPVTGNYLLSKGIKNGKKIGLLLKQIEKKWIDNNFSLNDKEITSLLKKNI